MLVSILGMSSTSSWTVSRPGWEVLRALRRGMRRPAAITVLPCEWKCFAKASPRPEVAPMMRTVSMFLDILCWRCYNDASDEMFF